MRGVWRALAVVIVALPLSLSAARAASSFTVNDSGDTHDAAPGDGSCADADGACTFRAALEETSALAGVQTIRFAVSSVIVSLSTSLGTNDAVVIDGGTAPGHRVTVMHSAPGDPPSFGLFVGGAGSRVHAVSIQNFKEGLVLGDGVVVQNGTLTGNDTGLHVLRSGNRVQSLVVRGNGTGVLVEGSNNVLGGTATGTGLIVTGNDGDGVDIGTQSMTVAATGNALRGSFVGVEPDGTPAGNGGNGVAVAGTDTGSSSAPQTTNNVIGPGNVIAAQVGAGVRIANRDTSANRVVGNYVGVEANGEYPLSNGAGIVVTDSRSNVIGGTSPPPSDGVPATGTSGNLVSGNKGDGVSISGPSAGGNMVRGNWIGIDIDGTAAVPNATGVHVSAPLTVVGGTAAGAGNVISGNGDIGLAFDAGASGGQATGNLIGTNRAGTAAVPNAGNGIAVGAAFVVIGGAVSAARNVVSGNGGAGVDVGAGGSATISGNYIGLRVNGQALVGNGGDGVHVHDGGLAAIGQPGVGNVISGNVGSGVVLDDGTTGNFVSANLIGLDATGARIGFGNDGEGVLLVHSSGNTIGGGGATRNVISGNRDGVVDMGSAAGPSDNVIDRNLIGTDITGLAYRGNALDGILVKGGAGDHIGANTVAGNGEAGIHLVDTDAVSIVRNLIGATAPSAPAIGNRGDGVLVDSSTDTAVGSPSPSDMNVISGNSGNGIAVVGSSSGTSVSQNTIGVSGGAALGNALEGVLLDAGGTTVSGNQIKFNRRGILVASGTGNRISSNALSDNRLLGIDLAPAGITPNDVGDADTGPNGLQNFPANSAATTDGATTRVTGFLKSTASTTFTLEFFQSQSCDSSTYGEGAVFVGSLSVTTNSGGSAVYTKASIPRTTVGWQLTATATDPAGNTSEFSQCRAITQTP